jgi:hypothetical protein
VKVPVVVNVAYRTKEQNVSLAQIRRQISVLNRDFAKTNKDRTKVPEPWKGLAADTRLRFKLAKVTRTETTRPSFSTDDGVKFAEDGGVAPLAPKKNLNLWVCALSNGILGYAQFPGGRGRTASSSTTAPSARSGTEPPFDLGRSHPPGHPLLLGVWVTPDCSGSDFVADTPNSAGPNYGTPAFPSVSCGNGPHGDMFMNYMDYVDDAAMVLFTAQQVTRMRTALEGARPGLRG